MPAAPPPRFPFGAAALDAAIAVAAVVAFSFLLVMLLVAGAAVLQGWRDPGATFDQAAIEAMLSPQSPVLLLGAVMAMVMAALLVWAVRGRGLAPLPAPRPWRQAVVIASLTGLGIQALSIGFGQVMARMGSPVSPTNAEPVEAIRQLSPWLAWLLVVGAAPFAEELLFRHVLLRRFALAGHALAGAVLSSLLFALMHELPGAQGWGPWLATTAMYTAMGCGFAWVYLRTGRLAAAVLAHAVCNAAALAALALSTA